MHGESYVNRSEPKALVGKKRDSTDVEEKGDSSCKRVKIPDIESLFRSEESRSSLSVIDLNFPSTNDVVFNDASIRIKKTNKLPSANNGESREKATTVLKPRGFDFDLNADDFSSSANDPFYPYKKYEYTKPRYESMYAMYANATDEKWPKQSNYMPSLHGCAPLVPMPSAPKKSNEEQFDRLAKITAPSGLLKGLNPSIINHVRNRRQVHSIIEAVIKSKSDEGNSSRQANHNLAREFDGINLDNNRREFSTARSPTTEVAKGDCIDTTKKSSRGNADDGLSSLKKLPSHLPVASEDRRRVSNEESGNSGITSLAVRAANVASQWLGLVIQDYKGRLSALRRSKKRVQAVLSTELPLLFSREFSSQDSNTGLGSPDAHYIRWRNIFKSMENALSEEEKCLEKSLSEVKEMLGNCEKGLDSNNNNSKNNPRPPMQKQQADALRGLKRLGEVDYHSKLLAVHAAAASLYSTCSYLMTTQNQENG